MKTITLRTVRDVTGRFEKIIRGHPIGFIYPQKKVMNRCHIRVLFCSYYTNPLFYALVFLKK